MPIIARDSSAGGESFEPAPAGIHRAVCVDVVDQGMVPGKFGERHKVRLVWQLEAEMKDGKPYMASRSYGLTLSPKGDLRKDLESWRGKPFTLSEAAGFDVERVCGIECTLFISHSPKESGGGVWANVTAVVPKQPGRKLTVRDYVRVALRHGEQPQPVGPSHAPAPTGYVTQLQQPHNEPGGTLADPFGPSAPNFEEPDEPIRLTAEDIPFAWALPLLLPMLGLLS